MNEINYEAAWELYYALANRRRLSGLTYNELKAVIGAALAPIDELVSS